MATFAFAEIILFMEKKKLMRLTTVDLSLDKLIRGQLRYMNQYFDVVGVAANTGLLKGVAEREGIRVIEVPMHREISLVNDVKSLWRLVKLMKKEKPYILHCNTPKGSLLGLLAGKIAGVPHRIYTVTGLRYQGAHGKFRWLLQTMERISCACATRVFPEGQGVLHTLQTDKITNNPLQVLHYGNINGIDTEYYSIEALATTNFSQENGGVPTTNFSNSTNASEYTGESKTTNFSNSTNSIESQEDADETIREIGVIRSPKESKTTNFSNSTNFIESQSDADKSIREIRLIRSLREKLGFSDTNFVFVFVGRIVKDKGINELTRCMQKLSTDYANAKNTATNKLCPKLLLVGSFDDDDPIDAENAEYLKTSPHVKSVGWQEDVRPFLAAADTLVFPSYREGFPNVPIQAGAFGVPSIVTAINGCDEIIKDGLNGKIIVGALSGGSEAMETALYNTMKWFIEHPEEVRRMSRNCRDLITSRYEQRDVWEATLRMYQSL